MQKALTFIVVVFFSVQCFGQSWHGGNPFVKPFIPTCNFAHDSTPNKAKHSAKKATIYSALLPGLGQIYNKNYVKAGLINASIITAGAIMFENRKFLREHREDLQALTDLDPNTEPINEPTWNVDRLRAERDYRLQNRDYSLIAIVVIYGLNIVDANVSGHLFEFDINQKLSAKVAPQSTIFGFHGLKMNLYF